MQTKILSIIVAVAFFIFIVELVRRKRLTFKYAFGWMIFTVLGLIFIIFDQMLSRVAALFGFSLPSNFIFYAMGCFFTFLSLLLTTFLCQQERRNEIMAQRMAILETQINEQKQK